MTELYCPKCKVHCPLFHQPELPVWMNRPELRFVLDESTHSFPVSQEDIDTHPCPQCGGVMQPSGETREEIAFFYGEYV